jgi:putative ABC transport system permease protein
MGYLRFGRKNAAGNKKLTVCAVIAISICVFLLVTLRTIVTDLTNTFDRTDPNRLVVSSRISAVFQLPQQYGERIKRIPGVAAVTAISWYRGTEVGGGGFFNVACEPDTLWQVYSECQIPEEQANAFINEHRAAIAGRALAEQFGWKLGDPIKMHSTLHYSTVEVVLRGIYTDSDKGEELNLFFHQDYLEEVIGRPGKVRYFWVRVEPGESLDRVAKAIDAEFVGTSTETRTEPEGMFRKRLVPWADMKNWILWISIPVILTIFLASIAAMYLAGRRRTREIAVLKVLGFDKVRLLRLLMSESLLIALAGGVIGSLAAWYFQTRVLTNAMLPLDVKPGTILLGVGLALFAGAAGAAVAFYRVSRTTITDGLRQG